MGIPESERNFASVEDGGWYVRHVKSGFRLGQPQGIFPRYVEPEASD
jgi:hypothetical protein